MPAAAASLRWLQWLLDSSTSTFSLNPMVAPYSLYVETAGRQPRRPAVHAAGLPQTVLSLNGEHPQDFTHEVWQIRRRPGRDEVAIDDNRLVDPDCPGVRHIVPDSAGAGELAPLDDPCADAHPPSVTDHRHQLTLIVHLGNQRKHSHRPAEEVRRISAGHNHTVELSGGNVRDEHIRREGNTVLALVDSFFRRNADRLEPGLLETIIGINKFMLVHHLVQQNSNFFCHTGLLWHP